MSTPDNSGTSRISSLNVVLGFPGITLMTTMIIMIQIYDFALTAI